MTLEEEGKYGEGIFESETIEQVFERCTSTDYSARDREEIFKAMQEYSFIQNQAFKNKFPGALEIQAHAKVLSEEEFRDYIKEIFE